MEASSKTLPKIGEQFEGGTYAGVLTGQDGALYALILLVDRPSEDLNWKTAMAWAAGIDGDLPNRVESAHLFAVLREQFKTEWHWTNEAHERDASYAWCCLFGYGYQLITRKSAEGAARAVRRLPIHSFNPYEDSSRKAAEGVDALKLAVVKFRAACDAAESLIADIEAA